MASLSNICSALASTIAAGSTTPVFAYDSVADMVNFPAVMAMPADGDFTVTMGRVTEWQINLFVLCQRGADSGLAQKQLDGMIDGWGDNSIRQIVFENDDLGLGDGTDAMVLGVSAYGGSFESGTVPAVGAIMKVRVLTDPSA